MEKRGAFWSFVGMVWGIAWASAATLLTWATNPLITWAWFTVGLRLWNGIWQEVWNTGEWVYEQTSWKTINDGNNKVEKFWQWFLRGVWWLDQEYEEIWTWKFLSQLGFDYVASAATFELSNKFWWFLWKLEGVKFAGWALKFGMEELIIENFLVDIPNNIIQTWFETLTGIDNQIMVWNTVVGQKTWLENERETKAGSLSDMILVMWDAFKQNFSFENMSQTLFNTVIYGWLLEWGWAAFRKMRSSLPSGQVANFEAKSAISMAALGGFSKFLTDSNLKVDQKTWKLIDSKTGNALIESDPRVQEMRKHWESIQTTGKEVITSMQTLIETQKKIIADPNNPQGLLFRLWLISLSNSPLNILKKKKEIAEKRLADEKAKSDRWDSKKITQLEQLISQYTDAEIKIKNWLSESTTDGSIKSEKESYFEGKESKFWLSEVQARKNSQFMDQISSTINQTNQTQQLQNLNTEISKQYQEATGKELHLSDDQLLSILDAHKQDGKLGNLTLWELKKKVEVLDQTIIDPEVRRFLLEAGFCGRPQVVEETIIVWNKKYDILYRWDNGDIKIINTDWTECIVWFWNYNGKYLSFGIEWKIDNTEIMELLHSISKKLWLNGKIWLEIWQIAELTKSIWWKLFIEQYINSKYFSTELIRNISDFEVLLKLGIKLPKQIFSQDFLKTLIDNNIFFEARAKINYLWNNETQNYFKEMVWKGLESIDIQSYNSELLSDLIIDYHFNKISYNVFLDIKELLRFQIEKWDFIPIENLKIYRDILKIDKLSNEEKINLHNSLIGKNIAEMFNNDLERAKERSKNEITNSILNHETIEKYEDKNLSNKYWVKIYNLDWQPFYALAKKIRRPTFDWNLDYTLTKNLNRPDYAITRSFSLVWTECTHVWWDPWLYTFIYEWLSSEQIMHVCDNDSSSWSSLDTEYWQRTEFVYFLWWPSELLSNTNEYNELLIKIKWKANTNENNRLNDIRPFAMYTYKITEEVVNTAKKYGVWIALINENKYNNNKNQRKWHKNIWETYIYPWLSKWSEDYFYAKDNRRQELCFFEEIDTINKMIDNHN